MEKWLWVTLLLCMFGFFKEVRPSESFLTQYLEEWKNLTLDQINNEVYPVWTYSYLALLFVVLLITDFLRYKPVIVLEGIAYVVTWCLLLWAQGVLAMQFMEFCYGIVTATEVAYYTYIYAKVPKEHYKKATSFTRAATLFGKFLSGTLAQVLVSTNVLDYHQLNYISLADVSVACLLSFVLPSVATSIYFHKRKRDLDELAITPETDDGRETPTEKMEVATVTGDTATGDASASVHEEYVRQSCGTVFRVIWDDFKAAYTNSHQLKWCLWWALATCSYEQTTNYLQSLWEVIYPSQEHQDLYNGAVDAANTLLSTAVVLLLGFLPVNWDKWGELTLAISSFVQAALLLVSAETTNIWIAYVFSGLYIAVYYMLITVASFQVAKKLKEDSYGLVFGCNQFLALILQTIMTIIVVDECCLAAGPRTQFLVYGSYNGVIGILFLIIAIHTFCTKRSATSTTTT